MWTHTRLLRKHGSKLSDDWTKGKPAWPVGSLKSKPAWTNTSLCSSTSAFLFRPGR